ncbi:MAG: sigma-70 family RNA polymerase sigma factor [Planctomycetota bacterium]
MHEHLVPDSVESKLPLYLGRLEAFLSTRVSAFLLRDESRSDLVQSICREALEAGCRDRFEAPQHFANWLFKIAVGKLADRARYWNAQKRRRSDVRHSVGMLPASDDTPSQLVSRDEQIHRARNALHQLPEDQREVVVLARMLDMTHSEIAKIMERSEQATRQLLCRAMARLGSILAESEDADRG